jgi:hypothetical protein
MIVNWQVKKRGMHVPGAGKYDVIIISPAGRSFKTKAELRTYLEKEAGKSSLAIFGQNFHFSTNQLFSVEKGTNIFTLLEISGSVILYKKKT